MSDRQTVTEWLAEAEKLRGYPYADSCRKTHLLLPKALKVIRALIEKPRSGENYRIAEGVINGEQP